MAKAPAKKPVVKKAAAKKAPAKKAPAKKPAVKAPAKKAPAKTPAKKAGTVKGGTAVLKKLGARGAADPRVNPRIARLQDRGLSKNQILDRLNGKDNLKPLSRQQLRAIGFAPKRIQKILTRQEAGKPTWTKPKPPPKNLWEKATRESENAFDKAAEEAGEDWDDPGLSEGVMGWSGAEDFESDYNSLSRLGAARITRRDKAPEGATLRRWGT